MANTDLPSTPSRLLTIQDPLSRLIYLIDTGAEVSVLPPRADDRSHSPDSVKLQAANGSTIQTFGRRTVKVELGLAKPFTWSFTVADVTKPIIGADFLRFYGLLVDVGRKRLMDAETFLSVPTTYRHTTISQLCVIDTEGDGFSDILDDFKDIITPCIKKCRLMGKVEHNIDTGGSLPVFARARRLAPDKLAVAKAEFDKLLDMNIVRPSNSPWSSPMHMVVKPSGGWRVCGDYRALNAVSQDDRYPLPHLHDFSIKLRGAQIFSKVDLVRAYNQVPMSANDIAKTAIVTPFGLFEYLRMPFGLKNAAQTFQRFMDGVFRDIPFAYVYLDDILVASSSVEEHRSHLRQLFERLAQYGLVVNPQKCTFGQTSLDFLGHRITPAGILPLQDRVQAIRNYPQPRTAKALKEYLGLLNFYRRFVPHAAAVLLPLYDLANVKDKLFSAAWTTTHDTHFQQSKDVLAAATCLAHPSHSAETRINTDASDTAVGAVLQQYIDGVWTPISFFSRKLHPAEAKYSAFDKELLAMYLAVKKFRYFIEGRPFALLTDHKPLTFAFRSVSDRWSPRQQRHLAFVSEFTTNVQHVRGVDNVVADALSRVVLEDDKPVAVVSALDGVWSNVVDYTTMSTQQSADAVIQQLVTDQKTSLRLIKCAIPGTTAQLWVDVSTGRPRPLVPAVLTKTIFDANHQLSHAGSRAMRRMICDRFVWPGMSKDIRQWARSCLSCQRAKIATHVSAPIAPLPIPSSRFESVHIDLVGPLPPSQGFSYLLTIVDRFTRWPEAIPLADMTALTCARAFLLHWVARFGSPVTITSDRGRQFVSDLWKKTASLLGTTTNATTAYHPQSNGMVERMHRTLKAALKAKLESSPNWVDALPVVLLGMRAAVKHDLNCSTSEMVYGEQLRLPAEFFVSTECNSAADPEFVVALRHHIRQLRPVPPRWHGGETRRSFVNRELATATHVFIRVDAHRSPLQAPYRGPYLVLERHDKYFCVDLGNRRDTVSIDRLKPAFMDEPVQLPVGVPAPPRLVQTPARVPDALPGQSHTPPRPVQTPALPGQSHAPRRPVQTPARVPDALPGQSHADETTPVVTTRGRRVRLPERYRL